MYAVIKTGGKQYRVKEGDLLSIEKIEAEKGQKVHFDQVLLIEDGEKIIVGMPLVENALVNAEIIENYKDEKVLVFKKKRRKQYRRTRGHRQPLTRIRVESIVTDAKIVPDKEALVEAKPKKVLPKEKPAAETTEKAEAKVIEKKDVVEKTAEKEEAKPRKPKKETAVKVKTQEKPAARKKTAVVPEARTKKTAKE